MKIAVIGTGHVGSVLGMRWARNGHRVVFGSRTPDSEHAKALLAKAGPNSTAKLPHEAIIDAEVVVLATPHRVVEQIIKGLGKLNGKIIIDPINPLNEDVTGLTLGTTTSVGEQIAALIPGASVIKAFNMTGASENMADPVYGHQKLSMLICGDDAHAKSTVTVLVEELDFEVVDCGPITASRYLEPLAMLWITLAGDMGMGGDMGFRIITR